MLQKKSIIFFLILSVLGIISVFFYTGDTASLLQVAEQINIGLLLLCIIGVPLADWLIAGLRMWIFSSVLCPTVSYSACVRNCAIGSFMCSVTPSQTGGGVAQIWVLTQEGARTGQAIAVLVMTFLTTLCFYIVGAMSLWFAADSITFPASVDSGIFATAVSVFGIVAAGLMLALIFPKYVIANIERYAKKLNHHPRLASALSRLVNWLRDSSNASDQILKKHKFRFMIAIFLSILIFMNKFLAAYFAALALGIEISIEQVIIIQMFLHILLYFLPTPGGSGGAEIGATLLMASLIPESLLAAHTIIWRSALAYFAVLIGGLFFIRYVQKAGTKANILSNP